MIPIETKHFSETNYLKMGQIEVFRPQNVQYFIEISAQLHLIADMSSHLSVKSVWCLSVVMG